jgi:hypothetical protein
VVLSVHIGMFMRPLFRILKRVFHSRAGNALPMIPNEELQALFKQAGLCYVDNSLIPTPMKDAGWSTEVWQKETTDGHAVVQILYGPNSARETVCLRKDALHILPDGNARVLWDLCEHSHPCNELFDLIPKTST